jgi:hypothetical protein
MLHGVAIALNWLSRSTKDPLAMTCICYISGSIVLFPGDYFQLLRLYAEKIALAAPLLVITILAVSAIARSPSSPLARMIMLARQLPTRLYRTLAACLLFLTAFTVYKINIPNIVPFYADPMLASFGEWLYGIAPWRVLHRLPPVTGLLVDVVYSRLWFGIILGVVIYVAITASVQEYKRYMWSMALTFLIAGTVLALAFSSVGPIFYDEFYQGGRFADLEHMVASNPLMSGEQSIVTYLYASYKQGTPMLGTGISAMPSMHVALAVLIAWYFTARSRAGAIFGWLFAITIGFGSVYTGWHYAADGYVSMLVVSAIWIGVSRSLRMPLTNSGKSLALLSNVDTGLQPVSGT